jgi:DNA-binding SARP family transcriptional activator
VDARLEYRLLGPMEVLDGDRLVSVGGGKQLSLLALLLIHANELLSTDRLIDELWGESPPPTAGKSLHVQVSRLRKALGGERPHGGPVLTRGNGYVLRTAEEEVDCIAFERRLEAGQRKLAAGDPGGAARLLDEGLELWRGAPLSGLEYQPFAREEILRLEELRLVALECRANAALELGQHARLVGELEGLVRAHPLRERFRAQLMVALYRSGRQTEALAVYRDAQHVLSEELGLAPGEELRRLETEILRQDAALDLPEQAPAMLSPTVQPHPSEPERGILVAPATTDALTPLLGLAMPLSASSPPRELIVAAVVEPAELAGATAELARRRDELSARGLAARTAAFSSPAPGDDLVRLASEPGVDLMLMPAGESPLEGETAVVLERAQCDVALMVEAGGPLRAGPVIVPFGGAWHDWAALELGSWVARATAAPLRLIGAAAGGREDGRDASRLLADASLIVQRKAGVVAEPMLGSPGREGVMALAAGAGLLVVGFSERWRKEGLGRVRGAILATPPAPALLVRRGGIPGGQGREDVGTRFGWSLTAGAP